MIVCLDARHSRSFWAWPFGLALALLVAVLLSACSDNLWQAWKWCWRHLLEMGHSFATPGRG